MSGGLFGVVYALVNGHVDGWTSVGVVTSATVGVALLLAFVRHGTVSRHSMLPMRLFRDRTFAGINAASMLMYLGMFGSIFLLSQFMQSVLGYSPTEAGLRMLPWTGMPLLVSPLAGYLSDRIGGRPIIIASLTLQAIGLGLFALVLEPGMSYAAMLPAQIAGGFGMALFFAPAASLVMSSVQPAEQGMASGANNALREVGGALGVAALAAVFAAQGGYSTPWTFTDGIVPALWIGAGAVAVGAIAALLMERRANSDRDELPRCVLLPVRRQPSDVDLRRAPVFGQAVAGPWVPCGCRCTVAWT